MLCIGIQTDDFIHVTLTLMVSHLEGYNYTFECFD